MQDNALRGVRTPRVDRSQWCVEGWESSKLNPYLEWYGSGYYRKVSHDYLYSDDGYLIMGSNPTSGKDELGERS